MARQYFEPGYDDRLPMRLPHSEVCMHMQVAGHVMDVQVVPINGPPFLMAQLLRENGSLFSFPILMSEAGFYWDSQRVAYYTNVRDGIGGW